MYDDYNVKVLLAAFQLHYYAENTMGFNKNTNLLTFTWTKSDYHVGVGDACDF